MTICGHLLVLLVPITRITDFLVSILITCNSFIYLFNSGSYDHQNERGGQRQWSTMQKHGKD